MQDISNSYVQSGIKFPEVPENEFECNILNDSNQKNECPECHKSMKRYNYSRIYCEGCGYSTTNLHFMNLEDMYVNGNPGYTMKSYLSFKIQGPSKEATLQNYRLLGATSDSVALKNRSLESKIMAKIHQYTGNDHIPQNVVRSVVESYSQLQNKDAVVKRAGVLDGIIACLIHYKCNELGATKKHKSVAKIMQVTEEQMSYGEKVIRKCTNNADINIPKCDDDSSNFIDQYFEKLELNTMIDDKYKEFVRDLIEASSKKNIQRDNNSRQSTKCAGAIYILCQQLELDITRDQIEIACDITKNTFIKYSQLIAAHIKKPFIKEVFDKYEVPYLKHKTINKRKVKN